MTAPDDQVVLAAGETLAQARVSHVPADRPDPEAMAGEPVDDSDLYLAELGEV